MKVKIIITFFILIILIWLNYIFPWTLLTNYNEYSLHEKNPSNNLGLSIVFKNQIEEKKIIIPFIYKYINLNSPYTYNLSILWNFDEVKNIEWYFEINWDKKINLDLKWWDIRNIDNKNIFLYSSNNILVLDMDKLKSINLVLKYIWVKNWEEKEYNKNISIRKEYFHYVWSYLLRVLWWI